jgi:hypothetical protein
MLPPSGEETVWEGTISASAHFPVEGLPMLPPPTCNIILPREVCTTPEETARIMHAEL